jgi:hypothetical protein
MCSVVLSEIHTERKEKKRNVPGYVTGGDGMDE